MDCLPDHVIGLIFGKTSNPADLFRVKCVCRQWYSIISDPKFIRHYFANRLSISDKINAHFSLVRFVYDHEPRTKEYPILTNLKNERSMMFQTANRYLFTYNQNESFTDFSLAFWVFVPNVQDQFRLFLSSTIDVCILFWGYIREEESKLYHIFSEKLSDKQKKCTRSWCHITFCWQSGDTETPPRASFWFNGENYPATIPINAHKLNLKTCDVSSNTIIYYGLDENDGCRVIDVQLFPFCLTSPEVKAVYEQETCFSKVAMTTYFDNQRC